MIYAGIRTRKKWNAKSLSAAAISVALAFTLSSIRLFEMPQHGAITPASMLPIFIFAFAFGPAQGCFVGLAYGVLQWMQDGFYMLTPTEAALDYLLAFAALGIAGMFRKLPEKYALPVGCFVGTLLRAVIAVVSGVVFFAEYAEGQPVLLYSLGYNGFYLLPEAVICVLIACVPQVRNIAKRLPTR